MPIHKQAPASSFSIESPDLESFSVIVTVEEAVDEEWVGRQLSGEIVYSVEIADTPGGWHLVWLDESIEFGGIQTAHIAIAARWVARQIALGVTAPVHIRVLPDVEVVENDCLDVEALPVLGKGIAVLGPPEGEE